MGNLCDTSLLAVPHRAKDAPKDLVIGFNSSDKFGAIFGDQRTSEELHALGNPANYLDVGVVVQPMYYYMGHISRYVRPGSRSIDAMVDSSSDDDGCRTFRPKGQTVAGGGINNLARVGMDITVWPCEGSTRQKWKLNDEGQLQLFGHDWLGHPTTTCAGNVIDKDYKGLTLTECNSDDAGKFSIVGNESESKQGVNLVLANGDSGQQSCLSVKPLENNGGAAGLRGGSQVATGNCDEASVSARSTEH